MAPLFPIPILSGIIDIIALIFLIIIGLVIIVIIASLIIFLLPAAIVAFVVWFLTGSLFLAGIAFLIIAIISAIRH